MSGQEPIKIILDTGVWINFLTGKTLSSLAGALAERNVKIILSDKLKHEISRVLQYPPLKNKLKKDKLKKFFSILKNEIKSINPDSAVTDAKENFLLELAVSVHADYIVTEDAGLLELNPYKGVKIIRALEMENIIPQIFK